MKVNTKNFNTEDISEIMENVDAAVAPPVLESVRKEIDEARGVVKRLEERYELLRLVDRMIRQRQKKAMPPKEIK